MPDGEVEQVARRHVEELRTLGFTILEGIIAEDDLPSIRAELEEAQTDISADWEQCGPHGLSAAPWRDIWPEAHANSPLPAGPLAHNLVNFPGSDGGSSFPQSQLARAPRFAERLAHPLVLAVARAVMDDHVRILHVALLKTRPANNGTVDDRGYHSDFPHDLASFVSVTDPGGDSGSGRPEERRDIMHCGATAQPFPDYTMCLSTIWLLSPSSPSQGGTWVIPGSHRDPRNPRSTVDGIDGMAPIPGELQVTAPAGSVYIQGESRNDSTCYCVTCCPCSDWARPLSTDCRTWHTAAFNPSSEPRVAAVIRYAPWWLSAEFGWGDGAQEWLPEPIYSAMTHSLQPLVSHRACGVADQLQPLKLESIQMARQVREKDRAVAAGLLDDSDGLSALNAGVTVTVPPADVRLNRAEQRRAAGHPLAAGASHSLEGRLLELSARGCCVLDGVVPAEYVALLGQQLLQQQHHGPQLQPSTADVIEEEGHRHALESCPALAEIFANPDLLELASAALDSHLRIIDLEFVPPAATNAARREWRTSPPHDLCSDSGSGAVRFPFPPMAMALTATLFLDDGDGTDDDYGEDSSGGGNGCWVIPGSHRDQRHPHVGSEINAFAPLQDELWLAPAATGLAAGKSNYSLVVCDTRLWHSLPAKHGSRAVATLAPWWLSCEFGARQLATVPRLVFDALPSAAAKVLYRHRAIGVGDLIQQPRPFDGWRADSTLPRRDNSWVRVYVPPAARI